jgi:hypothetical protein
MASHKKEEALPLLEELIMFGVNQFYYGKTNVLGYGYLFSACVCYKFLHEHALFDQVSFFWRHIHIFFLDGDPRQLIPKKLYKCVQCDINNVCILDESVD